MTKAITSEGTLPAELCGCPIDCALSPEAHSYLAIGPGGRGIVLKKLDDDCLWEGSLHPTVKERLNRVRKVAHPGLANLFGVSRDQGDAYLMWEFVEGVPLDQHAGTAQCGPRELASIARELILTVDLLHVQGIVHGALIASNILVLPSGGLRLTHVSPLLYDDPAVDSESVISLLEQIAEQKGEAAAPFAQVIADARQHHLTLRQLGTKLAVLNESAGTEPGTPAGDFAAWARRRAIIGAALVLVTGLATASGIWYAVQNGRLSAAHVWPSALEMGR